MAKYECKICGYIYDPEKGDPDGGIAPGTPFEEIPDDGSVQNAEQERISSRKCRY